MWPVYTRNNSEMNFGAHTSPSLAKCDAQCHCPDCVLSESGEQDESSMVLMTRDLCNGCPRRHRGEAYIGETSHERSYCRCTPMRRKRASRRKGSVECHDAVTSNAFFGAMWPRSAGPAVVPFDPFVPTTMPTDEGPMVEGNETKLPYAYMAMRSR